MIVTYVDHMGTDLSVVNAARVSFNKKSDWQYSQGGTGPVALSDRDNKLIHYLASHEHMSPFGHCFVSLHLKAPIFVARQLVKHKFLRWNEVSRRYVDDEPEFYEPDVWRGRATDKKQGSSGEVEVDLGPEPWYYRQMAVYHKLLDQGVAPEQARIVLPLSMYTEWYWSGSLDAFAEMYNLRSKTDTQKETQDVARQIGGIIEPLYPVSWKALTQGEESAR